MDQVPMISGAQSFSSRFSVMKPTAPCIPDCETKRCGNGVGGTGCPGNLICNAVTKACMPRPGACPTKCPSSFVCNETIGVCVVDCRPHGMYGGCDAGMVCNQSDGLCRAK